MMPVDEESKKSSVIRLSIRRKNNLQKVVDQLKKDGLKDVDISSAIDACIDSFFQNRAQFNDEKVKLLLNIEDLTNQLKILNMCNAEIIKLIYLEEKGSLSMIKNLSQKLMTNNQQND